jgi:hypothetical protein
MATDPPPDARRSAPAPASGSGSAPASGSGSAPASGSGSASGPDDPASDLVAQVHNYSRAVIEAELRRLARSAPSLRPNDLEVIDATLDELVESLLLARLRSLPQHTARLKRLFGTAGEDP